jgi:hypothetical protein
MVLKVDADKAPITMSWSNAKEFKGKILAKNFDKDEHLNKLKRTSVDDGMTKY